MFVNDRNGRTLAYVFAADVVMRSGLDSDRDAKRKIAEITGKPIREAQRDHNPGCSRVIRCFKCNNHFTPDQKIDMRFGVPYHDAGWRPFHAEC